MKVLSLTHECIPDYDKSRQTFVYRGASPDEVTLVEFAKDLGFTNTKSNEMSSSLKIELLNKTLDFKVIRRMEFTSDRKRMSVIV